MEYTGTDAELSVSEDSPIHANNAHYAVLEVHRPGAALVNNGFDGIAVKKGEKYDFSSLVSGDKTLTITNANAPVPIR